MGSIGNLDIFEVVLANGLKGVVVLKQSQPRRINALLIPRMIRTNGAYDSAQSQPCDGILEEVWAASTDEGRALTMAAVVVCSVRLAEQNISSVHGVTVGPEYLTEPF